MNAEIMPSASPILKLLQSIRHPSVYEAELNTSRRAFMQAKLRKRVNRDLFAFWLKRYLDAIRRGKNEISNYSSFVGYGKGYAEELRRQLGDGFAVVESRPGYLTIMW